MANFSINIGNKDALTVVKSPVVTTDCSTIVSYLITAPVGNEVTLTLTGTYINAAYVIGGVSTAFSSPVTIAAYATPITVSYGIENSGSSGIFNQVIFDAEDVDAVKEYTDTVVRANDGLACGDLATIKYDDLTDTPSSKIGHGGKVVMVSVDELTHEYVSVASFGDSHYEHTESPASTSWVIAHGLGKKPSVNVQDLSGNDVEGAITYTDINNLTITFNTAFEGVAYLN